MTGLVRIETLGELRLIILDQAGRRNILSRALLQELSSAILAATREGVRALALTGAERCFSAGADLAEIEGTAADLAIDEAVAEVTSLLQDASMLTAAAIEGPCMGAALDLACACDVRVVSPTAHLELPSVRLGLLYNPASVARLHRTLSSAAATRLLLLGERLDGREAYAAGLATHLAEEGGAVSLAIEIARRAAAATPAFAHTKRLLQALDRGGVNPADWQVARLTLLASPERQAAVAAAKSRLGLRT
jgi:enoyl-CoA hydratase/carnithine racemase